jgi:hypothetical protein
MMYFCRSTPIPPPRLFSAWSIKKLSDAFDSPFMISSDEMSRWSSTRWSHRDGPHFDGMEGTRSADDFRRESTSSAWIQVHGRRQRRSFCSTDREVLVMRSRQTLHPFAIVVVALMVVIVAMPLREARAQYERPGSSAAQFLKIGVNARAAAMADAFIAVTDGAEATIYNPAAIAWTNGTAVSFNHTELYAAIKHDFFGVVRSFEGYGSFGISFTTLYTDEMKVRTPLQPDGTGETFRAMNYKAGLSYARALTNRVSFGGTVSYIDLSLYSGFTANAVSLDIATLYTTDYRDFRFGMMISNFGSNIQFVSEDYPLPTNFTFGMSGNAIEAGASRLLLSVAAVKPNDGKPLGQIGAEWSLRDVLYLRGGYRPNHDTATYSLGAGVQTRIDPFELGFNYAYNDQSLLGAVHRFGIDLRF